MAKGINDVQRRETPEAVFNLIDGLDESSAPKEASAVVANVADAVVGGTLGGVAKDAALTKLKAKGINKGTVNAVIKRTAASLGPPVDPGNAVACQTLAVDFADGERLIRNVDRSFWHFTGTHWERLSDEQLQRRVQNHVPVYLNPRSGPSFAAIINQAMSILKGRQAADGDPLRLTQEPPPVVNCKNGELWIDEEGNVEHRPHRADSFIPYCLDVEYAPEAECPIYDQTVAEIFAERDKDGKWDTETDEVEKMVRHWNELAGYAIQPVRDLASFWMLDGGGDNGKSKLVETIARLMGSNAFVAKSIEELGRDKFAKGALAGKLMLVDDDVDVGTRLPDGLLKKISERKPITGQLKFKDEFNFICTALPVLLCNELPTTKDLTHGLRRRARVIPFRRRFVKDVDRDPKRFSKIWAEEMSGVLNRSLEGLLRLRKRGDFHEPLTCVLARDLWFNQANPLPAFIHEQCNVGTDERQELKEFFSEFRKWADAGAIRSIPPRNTIKGKLEALGYDVGESSAGNSEVRGLSAPITPG